jgi:hypothetical protein
MSSGALMMVVVTALAVGPVALVVASMIREIQREHDKHNSIWREYGLGFSLTALFVTSWVAQLIAEWQVYTDDQRSHGEPTEVGDFYAAFAQSTMENWQSEFLQLFTFVVLTGLYIHKGSAESKDGDERMEASLRRIEEHLKTLPDNAPKGDGAWKLPSTPVETG